ncbi:hypothetical protein GCM10020331_077840 [Ectobacillus funiculus]
MQMYFLFVDIKITYVISEDETKPAKKAFKLVVNRKADGILILEGFREREFVAYLVAKGMRYNSNVFFRLQKRSVLKYRGIGVTFLLLHI